MASNLRLTVSCPGHKGLICALSSFISMHDGTILSADQYAGDGATFLMRLEVEGEGFGLARDEFAGAFRPWPGRSNTRPNSFGEPVRCFASSRYAGLSIR